MIEKIPLEGDGLSDSAKRHWTPPEIVFVRDALKAEIAGGTEDDGGLLFQSGGGPP